MLLKTLISYFLVDNFALKLEKSNQCVLLTILLLTIDINILYV